MFDELKTLIRDLIRSTMARFEPIESDVKELKSDLADLKAFRDELKSSGFGDLKSDLDALGGKAKDENDLSGKTYTDLHPAAIGAVVDRDAGTTTHTATDGTVTTLDHETGTMTSKDASGEPAPPNGASINAVVQATADAGVAVPEAETAPVI